MILHSQGMGSTEPSLNDDGGNMKDDPAACVMTLYRLCSHGLPVSLAGPVDYVHLAGTAVW